MTTHPRRRWRDRLEDEGYFTRNTPEVMSANNPPVIPGNNPPLSPARMRLVLVLFIVGAVVLAGTVGLRWL